MVPFCCDNRSLMFPSVGAIFSGGGVGAVKGGTGTVGLACPVDGEFCASAGPAANINAPR